MVTITKRLFLSVDTLAIHIDLFFDVVDPHRNPCRFGCLFVLLWLVEKFVCFLLFLFGCFFVCFLVRLVGCSGVCFLFGVCISLLRA